MNRTKALLKAIESLWTQLPSMIGEDWPTFETQLLDYLAQLNAQSTPETVIRALIIDLFSQYPTAKQQLLRLMAQAEEPSEPKSKGITTRTLPQLLTRLLHPPTVRYTDISCPRRVWIQAQRISVVVRLVFQPPSITPSTDALEVREALPVRVRVDAPSFDILNETEQDTMILPDADSPPLVFDLRPRLVGPSWINFDFFQAGNPIGASSIAVDISPEEVSAATESGKVGTLWVESKAQAPDLMLFISYEHFQREPRLVFTLFRSGEVGQTFEPVILQGDPASHAERMYTKLTVLTEQVDPTSQALLRQSRVLRAEEVERHVKQLGQNLWRDLIPKTLKDLYLSEWQQWRDKTLLIVSDEPYIPWELVWPYAPRVREDDGPWCITMRMTRWLRRDAQGNGHAAPPSRLWVKSLACLAPNDSGLPSAQAELAFLSGLAAQNRVVNRSPIPPTWSRVLDLLEEGGYNWLHVAAHGNFYPETPETDSAIWLQDMHALTPEAFIGTHIEEYIAQERPGFVFNACHSAREGWALTRLGGWANRLVSIGAGLFLAPLWTVTDDQAMVFAKTLYRELLTEGSIAEAVRQARLAAHRNGDPSWLAYSIYAHPNLQIIFGNEKK